MKMIKKLLALFLILLSTCAFADLKVGIVDMQQTFENVPQGQAAADQLKKTLMPQANKLNTEQTALQTAITNFNRNVPTLSAADKASQEKALAAQQQQFQQDVAAFNKTEQTVQQNAAAAYKAAFIQAVNQVASAGNYDMIITDETIPFYKDALDVTSQVEKAMAAQAQE